MGDLEQARAALVAKGSGRSSSGCCVCANEAADAELTAIMDEMTKSGSGGLGIPSITRHLARFCGFDRSDKSVERHLNNCRRDEWDRAKGRA